MPRLRPAQARSGLPARPPTGYETADTIQAMLADSAGQPEGGDLQS